MIEKATLHTDGGSRGNPGPSGIGFVLLVDDGREMVTAAEGGAFIGKATNNEAEYQALLWGLANAEALDVAHLSIRADSELMVKQIKGEYRVRSGGIAPLFQQALRALDAFDSFDIRHVYREDNSRADTLANIAMDTRDSIGNFSVPCSVESREGDGSQRSFSKQDDSQRSFSKQDERADLYQSSGKDWDEAESSPRYPRSSQGTYTLTVKDHFDAAHALVGYPGECRELHGHTWDVEISVCGRELDEVGIVYDFKDLKADLASILTDYDHVFLNEVPPFDRINATAENLARIIFERIELLLPEHIDLEEVSVWESPIAKLTYRRP